MQFEQPLVSIITPSLNQGEYIEETIKSVLDQSYDNIEYIIMDGGSTDITPDIIKKYRNDPRIVWVSEFDKGQYDAVNKGFERARGRIIGWINADDVYTSDAVESIVRLFNEHSDIDIIYGRLYRFSVDISRTSIMFCRRFSQRWLRRYCYTNPSATFLRSDVVKRDGFTLDLRIPTYGDWDWYLRMARGKKQFVFFPRCITYFRTHAGSRIECMDRKSRYKERKLLSMRHGIPTSYMYVWIDIIVPWIERVQNIIRLMKSNNYEELMRRAWINIRSTLRSAIHFMNDQGTHCDQ